MISKELKARMPWVKSWDPELNVCADCVDNAGIISCFDPGSCTSCDHWKAAHYDAVLANLRWCQRLMAHIDDDAVSDAWEAAAAYSDPPEVVHE